MLRPSHLIRLSNDRSRLLKSLQRTISGLRHWSGNGRGCEGCSNSYEDAEAHFHFLRGLVSFETCGRIRQRGRWVSMKKISWLKRKCPRVGRFTSYMYARFLGYTKCESLYEPCEWGRKTMSSNALAGRSLLRWVGPLEQRAIAPFPESATK